MSTEFNPNIVAFGDRAGLGQWEIGHYRQHLRYLAALAARTPSVILQDHNIIGMGDGEKRKAWANDHQAAHAALRPLANITGTDYTGYNLDDEDDWNQFMSDHAAEHASLDMAFGVA
jgi:hypothetical protein